MVSDAKAIHFVPEVPTVTSGVQWIFIVNRSANGLRLNNIDFVVRNSAVKVFDIPGKKSVVFLYDRLDSLYRRIRRRNLVNVQLKLRLITCVCPRECRSTRVCVYDLIYISDQLLNIGSVVVLYDSYFNLVVFRCSFTS